MIFLDTSVLVAASAVAHENHQNSRRLLEGAEPGSLCTSTHVITELYSVMTGSLKPRRFSPKVIAPLIEQYAQRITVCTLTLDETLRVIRDCAASGVTGATIYDALILTCARKSKADAIYTYNIGHFRRIAPDIADAIRTP